MSCTRTREVSAERDGSLSPSERLRAVEHARGCAECREEGARLRALASRLASFEVPVDELALRRLRASTLARAEEARSGARPRRGHLRYVVAAGVAAAALAAAVSVRLSSLPHAPEAPARASAVSTVDEGGAAFTQLVEGEVERLVVRDGTLGVRVLHGAGRRRVVVRVPDGEIEDIGTVFHVRVEGGRTQRVTVDEGLVILRLGSDRHGIALGAGEEWIAPATPVAPVTPSTPLTPVAPVTASPMASAPRPRPVAPRPSPSIAPSLSPTAPSALPSTSEEDAAYLGVVALVRQGRTVEARGAARRYLTAFPGGLRRREMERVAQ